MKKRKKTNRQRSSRLGRIECKCDRILSELLVLRHRLTCSTGTDRIIDRLHKAAREMRRQCEAEKEAIRRLYNTSSTE